MGNGVCSREKKIFFGTTPTLHFGGEIQGWRSSMEDRTVVKSSLIFAPTKQEVSLFAIFDGHGSSQVSEFLSTEFCNVLQKQLNNEEEGYTIEQATVDTFVELDKMILEKCDMAHTSGSTAIILLVTLEGYYTVNLGDSRAMLIQNACYFDLTEDHKPLVESEKARIEKAKFRVSKDNRVNGMLNVSRAFGDFEFKTVGLPVEECAVSVIPDIVFRAWDHNDRYIVLFSDGLLEKFDSEALYKSLVSKMTSITSFETIVTELLDEATAVVLSENKGTDNSSILIIQCHSYLEKFHPSPVFRAIEEKLHSDMSTTPTPSNSIDE